MDKTDKENTIWNRLTKYAVPGVLGILMIYAVVSSGISRQSNGSELSVKTPEYHSLSSSSTSNPYSPELKDIFFDPESYKIRQDAKPVLDENAQVLMGEPDMFVVIEAYCDAREESASSLGVKRADSVKEYIVGQGVDPERVITANKCNIYDMQLVNRVDTERLDSRVRFVALDRIGDEKSFAVNR